MVQDHIGIMEMDDFKLQLFPNFAPLKNIYEINLRNSVFNYYWFRACRCPEFLRS